MTATLAPKSAPGIHDPLDAIKLARAMSWSQWQIYAVKKANAAIFDEVFSPGFRVTDRVSACQRAKSDDKQPAFAGSRKVQH